MCFFNVHSLRLCHIKCDGGRLNGFLYGCRVWRCSVHNFSTFLNRIHDSRTVMLKGKTNRINIDSKMLKCMEFKRKCVSVVISLSKVNIRFWYLHVSYLLLTQCYTPKNQIALYKWIFHSKYVMSNKTLASTVAEWIFAIPQTHISLEHVWIIKKVNFLLEQWEI